MIVNPDGSKRYPTVKERLDGIKSGSARNNVAFRVDSQNIDRSNFDNDNENGQYDSRPFELASERNRRDQATASNRPSERSTDARDTNGYRLAGNDNGSIDEYSGGITTTGGTNTDNEVQQHSAITNAPPLTKSKNDSWLERGKRNLKEVTIAIRGKDSTSSNKTKSKPRTVNKVLGEREYLIKRDKLAKSLLWQSDHLDEILKATTGGHDPSIRIWGSIDTDESIVLANVLVKLSAKYPQVNTAVDFMLEIDENIEAAVILLPRVYKSLMLYLARGVSIGIFTLGTRI